MLPLPPSRLTFIANPDRKIIVIRPIGDMSGKDFIDTLFASYARIEAPWSYGRLTDLRRFDGRLSQNDIQEIAIRWRTLVGSRNYHAYVANVSFDAFDCLRTPDVSKDEPRETVCAFSDYHEALGWLTAADKTRYLNELAPRQRIRRDDGRIRIE